VRSDERTRNHFFSYAKIIEAQVRMDGRKDENHFFSIAKVGRCIS